jgi:glycosyltransferase involved in cell wall biosynthesis
VTDAPRLNVWMVSFDPTMLDGQDSVSLQRHRQFAELAGRLSIITYTRMPKPEVSLGSLTVLASGSASPLTFVRDVLRQAGRLLAPPDLIVTQDMMLTGLAGIRLGRRFSAPVMVQEHSATLNNPAWVAEHPIRNRGLAMLTRYVLKRADFLRSENAYGCEQARRLGFPAERIVELQLPSASAQLAAPVAPEALLALRERLGIPADAPVIVWAGRAVPVKRLPLLIDVFNRVAAHDPDVHLLLLGNLDDAPAQLTAALSASPARERIIMPGGIAPAEMPAHYQLSTLFLLTSSYEGGPRVVMEAAAAGIPAVGTGVGGVSEVIVDGVTGLYIADGLGLADRLASAALSLLKNPARAAQMGKAAQARALDLYNLEGYAERWVSVWRWAVTMGKRA